MGRYPTAGTTAIELQTLVRERLRRYCDAQLPALGELALRSQVRLLDRHAKQQGLYRSATAEPEEKVFR